MKIRPLSYTCSNSFAFRNRPPYFTDLISISQIWSEPTESSVFNTVYNSSFFKSISWSTVSKVFLRSRKIAQFKTPLSIIQWLKTLDLVYKLIQAHAPNTQLIDGHLKQVFTIDVCFRTDRRDFKKHIL